MKSLFYCCAALVAALLLGTASARAQTLFSYELGEPGMPYISNGPPYLIGSSTTLGVTHATQSMTVTVPIAQVISFGGPLSTLMDPVADPTVLARTLAINAADEVIIDMTVPNTPFNFGNIDLTFFQAGLRGGAGNDETAFSGTYALSPGQTIQLHIPLLNTQFGTPKLLLDPAVPWAYQIDISIGTLGSTQFPLVFAFDNLRVPEPSSFAVAAVGSLAMLKRSRRKA